MCGLSTTPELGDTEQLCMWWVGPGDRKGPSIWLSCQQLQILASIKGRTPPKGWRKLAETGVHIMCTGTRHLGAALGAQIFIEAFATEKVSARIAKLEHLSLNANSEPHTAFSAFTHGLIGYWTYFLRIIDGLPSLMQLLDKPSANSFCQH